MPRVGFESTIPAFERAKTVHALDRAATVIGQTLSILCYNLMVFTTFYYSFPTESRQILEGIVLLNSHFLKTFFLHHIRVVPLTRRFHNTKFRNIDSFCVLNIRTVLLNAWINRSWIERSTVVVQSMLIVLEGKVEGC
jgi:hypothetical protein